MPESKHTAEPASRIFDLADSEGVNESERILTRLCKRSFLRLWSQSNVFTDEGFKDGKGGTKELCDALVIFGNDVIIFSDKHVKFHADRELEIAWPRWYKKAVLASCKQLHGAKAWLSRFPERAFLDARCTRKLPIALPRGSDARFHLVGVTRGSRDAAIAYRDGEGLGSLGTDNSLVGSAHLTTPFVVGLPDPSKSFVHIFDEVSIELIMEELDTAVDFLDYLKAREMLLGKREHHVVSPAEEELLAAYLRTTDHTGERHVFFEVGPENGSPGLILFDGSNYAGLKNHPGYNRKKEADKISYIWDRLIDGFIEHGDPEIHIPMVDQTAAETEEGLRLLAAESRFSRRQLAQALVDALNRVSPSKRLSRIVNTQYEGGTVFVFLIMPWNDEKSYDEYRENRFSMLHAYVRTARLRALKGKTFVGVAFDNPHKEYTGSSEDLFVYIKESWSSEELTELEEMRRELDLWRDDRMEMRRYRQDEFPQASQFVPIHPVLRASPESYQPHDRAAKSKAKKRLKKMQKNSRKKNRKR